MVGQSDESEALVRPLRAGDIDGLAALWVASWQAAMPEIDFSARRAWLVAFLSEAGLETLVIEVAGAAAGFATREGRYLHQLVVAQARKGSGLATVLLDAVKARACDGLSLDVNATNARAVRFFTRGGLPQGRRGTQPGLGASDVDDGVAMRAVYFVLGEGPC